MKNLVITLICRQQLFIELSIRDEVYGLFMHNFIKIFEHTIEQEKAFIPNIQVKSLETEKQLVEFISIYKESFPKIFALHTFFKLLNINQPFLLFFKELDREERIEASLLFNALEQNKPFLEIKAEHDARFGNFLERYEVIFVDGSRRFTFGEPIKSKRKCRYCNLNQSQGATFKKTAHVISEALGNKQVIDYNECDLCNDKFGKEIEPDLITFLDFYRSVFAVSGKEGIPSIKGKNFRMSSKDGILIESDTPLLFDKKHMELNLLHTQRVSKQNIYKALCKFAIGLYPKEDLLLFKNTIDWLKGDVHIEKLPLIAHSITNKTHGNHPVLTVFRKIKPDSQMPYAFAIFGFTVVSYLFIIPSKHDRDFTKETNFKTFWNQLNHLTKSRGWKFVDFSEKERKAYELKILFDLPPIKPIDE